MTPPKLKNYTVTNTNDSKVDEISDNKFKKIRIIKEIKEDLNKCMNEYQENTNKS
jgi:DNA topoisomerase IA